MLTIDWKERLTQDTEYYLQNKLIKQDYDFEIIFNAYPERSHGKIPSEVISFVSGIIVQRLGKKHPEQIPFFRYLWFKKGDYGKQAFAAIMSKLAHKKPDIYIPLMEEIMAKADGSEINALLDKVMLPLCRKHPEKYLQIVFTWSKRGSSELSQQALNLCIKLIKRREDLIPEVLKHFQNQWLYPLGEQQSLQVNMLKTIAKLDSTSYLEVWQEFGISRDPQIVELLCASIVDYHPEIEPIVELWTRSGNARVKKASNTAMRLIKRKKGV
ncbi:MAG: hypothetical protein PHU99_05230 [Candidatus Cloacimonetes bacterium]|jgi:hypothetical protein|nr:hypothetical protein [Candidatus Cloacimonadota bacterium]MDY0337330.1 hypothetical protein [Candidatus Cloacimonadaceae bacterium]MCK9334214.1 hypothetical protein [Candidatus Cloacimonadota bacterium]MDD2543826.1 hypothetical protein [Candidatus Cloacimonadota bacterium]MDD3097102.1 hypothetical protein [Candidatus Cloacimonadota bacterium]